MTIAMQDADARRARDTRVRELQLQLSRSSRDHAKAAAAASAALALVKAMVAEQAECEQGMRLLRDLTDPSDDAGRRRFLRLRTEEWHRRAHLSQGGM